MEEKIRPLSQLGFLYPEHPLLADIEQRDIKIAKLRRKLAAADETNVRQLAAAAKKNTELLNRLKAYTIAGREKWATR